MTNGQQIEQVNGQGAARPAVKFNKYHVTNGVAKARVSYSLDNRTDGRAAVTLYAKDYSDKLASIFPGYEYRNATDISSDYFERGRVVLFEQHPHYSARLVRRSLAWLFVFVGLAAANARRDVGRDRHAGRHMLIRTTTGQPVRVELVHDTFERAANGAKIYASRWRSYAPSFDAPVQRPDGKWVAHGTRSPERTLPP